VGKTVTVIIDDTNVQVLHDGVPLKTFPRTIHKEIPRHKAYQTKSPKEQSVKDQPNTICKASAEPRQGQR
jgi:hypothetical protein